MVCGYYSCLLDSYPISLFSIVLSTHAQERCSLRGFPQNNPPQNQTQRNAGTQMLQPVPLFPDLLSEEFTDGLWCPPLVRRFQNYILSWAMQGVPMLPLSLDYP